MVMNHIINIPYKLALQYMNFIYFIVQLISSISYVSQKPCGSNINVCSKNGFFVLFATEKFIVLCSHWRDYFWCQNSKCRKQIDTFIFSWKIDIILFEGIFWRFPISFNEFQKHKGKLLCSINLQTKYFWQVFQVHTLVLDPAQI